MSDLKESYTLYVAKASTMSLGTLSGVNFSFTSSSEESLHCSVAETISYTDDFGDPWVRTEIFFNPSLGVPIFKMRLQHSSGETGFDSNAVPDQILLSVLKDANLVANQSQSLVSFSDYLSSCKDEPIQFFMQKGSFPLMITYHQPDSELRTFLEVNRFSDTDAVTNIKLILETIHFCKAALIWSWAYGMNPVLISSNATSYISLLKERLADEGVSFKEVTDESMLPEW